MWDNPEHRGVEGDAFVMWDAVKNYLDRIAHEPPSEIRRHVARRISKCSAYYEVNEHTYGGKKGWYAQVPAEGDLPAFDAVVFNPLYDTGLPRVMWIYEPGTFAVHLDRRRVDAWPYGLTKAAEGTETGDVQTRRPPSAPSGEGLAGREAQPPTNTETGGEQ